MNQAADQQTHVVVGVGPVGTALAGELLGLDHRVRMISRTGRRPAGPEHLASHPHLEALALDAADPGALTEVTRGAAVLYNAANPADYHRWAQLWPPLAASLLTAAEATDAVLATVGKLYPYGPVDGAMHEGLPDAATFINGRIRAAMWADALAAHRSGRVRAVEIRASDYAGPGVYSHLSVGATSLLGGRTARVIAVPTSPTPGPTPATLPDSSSRPPRTQARTAAPG